MSPSITTSSWHGDIHLLESTGEMRARLGDLRLDISFDGLGDLKIWLSQMCKSWWSKKWSLHTWSLRPWRMTLTVGVLSCCLVLSAATALGDTTLSLERDWRSIEHAGTAAKDIEIMSAIMIHSHCLRHNVHEPLLAFLAMGLPELTMGLLNRVSMLRFTGLVLPLVIRVLLL